MGWGRGCERGVCRSRRELPCTPARTGVHGDLLTIARVCDGVLQAGLLEQAAAGARAAGPLGHKHAACMSEKASERAIDEAGP